MAEQLGSWQEAEYVAQWAGDDVIADMLSLPRRISVALVEDAGFAVEHVVDLGSGPGAYLEVFLDSFPQARGTWVDVSEPMQELARESLERFGDRVSYVIADLERMEDAGLEPASVVVSSRMLHHFSPESLERFYRTLHDLLVPGGFFFNLDHVGTAGDWEQSYRRIRDRFTGPRKKRLKPHRHDYPLPRTEQHVAWAERAGLEAPDVAWRMLYTALVLARRPA